ncbi:hypothetical protein ElyMa_000806500 [Elysia marginata]|uniref:Uncharacterized protein n=1 Tax=Elysia marginata TaxID=1093978 RepID=A0AAV4GX55_9GAST|nr:hypothetical protein ElyMa_000806500 [Elysia marginata]
MIGAAGSLGRGFGLLTKISSMKNRVVCRLAISGKGGIVIVVVAVATFVVDAMMVDEVVVMVTVVVVLQSVAVKFSTAVAVRILNTKTQT